MQQARPRKFADSYKQQNSGAGIDTRALRDRWIGNSRAAVNEEISWMLLRFPQLQNLGLKLLRQSQINSPLQVVSLNIFVNLRYTVYKTSV